MTNTINKVIHNGDEYLLPQYSVVKVTLESGNWANDEQTVTVQWVTSSNTIVVSPVPSSMSDYISWWIYYSAQGTDSVTFTSTTAVVNDIEVNVVILAEAWS